MLGVKQLIPGGRARKLVDLERKISPKPVSEGMDDDSEEQIIQSATIELINGLANGTDSSDEFKEYIAICREDPQIENLVTKRKLSEDTMIKMFRMLASSGLNRWIKGRNAALATFSEYTTLLFVVRALRKGTDWPSISSELALYWNGKTDAHALLSQTTRSSKADA